jgi:hypothetical protein
VIAAGFGFAGVTTRRPRIVETTANEEKDQRIVVDHLPDSPIYSDTSSNKTLTLPTPRDGQQNKPEVRQ